MSDVDQILEFHDFLFLPRIQVLLAIDKDGGGVVGSFLPTDSSLCQLHQDALG